MEEKTPLQTTKTAIEKVESKRIMEALLFATPDPLSLSKIREILHPFIPLTPKQIEELIQELKADYIQQQRAFQIKEIAQGYVLQTDPLFAPYLEKLFINRRGEKLTPAGAEVLAIIAYRQPITRPQMDAIRGVDSSGTLTQLIERQLVEAVGRLDAPGRPLLYGTTQLFLKHYGLNTLSDLREG